MHCKQVQQQHLEETTSNPEIARHLEQCATCNAHAIGHRQVRNSLRQLQKRTPPAKLTASLKVLASQERAKATQTSIGWLDRFNLLVGDTMRPFAAPAFGGLASAIVLFSALVPSLAMPIPLTGGNDVPLMLVTEPSVKNFPAIGIGESELVVDVEIDGTGRMVEYTVVRGAGLLKEDSSLKSQLENSLLFTEFTPATKFGGPASGRVRLRIKSSQITIRG